MVSTESRTQTATNLSTSRVQSVDVLRGLVMVLMAIDHVRVYSGLPAGGPDAGIFFTRWVTHFCAPAFVFFAGTSAFLYGKKINDAGKLATFLLSRGFMLVVLELTVIRFGWTFNLNFSEFALAGVIWMLGWCMVLLGLMVKLKPRTIGIAGLAIVFLQQVFALAGRALPEAMKGFWSFIYSFGYDTGPGLSILYVIVPWVGVMMAGYGFGLILSMQPAQRDKLCLQIGIGATALFLVAGSILAMLNDSPESPPFIFRLLNQQKYPASQLFLLMTIGPLIALSPLAERSRGRIADLLSVFGKVPLFYYLLHIPLIHITALVVNVIATGATHQEWYSSAPFAQVPEQFRWNLSMLYLVFLIDVVLLYFSCKWYVGYKARNPDSRVLKFI
jgi:uncharacterized membrane protein